MKKVTLIVMLITIVSKLFGFGREIALSYVYGASSVSDAYLISITIPSVIFGFIASSFSLGFIPVYNKVLQEKGKIEADKFTSNLINIAFALCTLIVTIGLIFTKELVQAFAVGFTGETLALAIQLTQFNLFVIYFIALIYIFTAYLHANNSFIVTALIGVPLNIIIILSIFISKNTGPIYLAIGFLLASFSEFALIIPAIKQKGFRYSFRFDRECAYTMSLVWISLPLVMGFSVNQINMLVDRTIASSISVGGISSLSYASILIYFVQGVFVVPITSVVYPTLSKQFVSKNMGELKTTLNSAIVGIATLVIPSTIGLFILAPEIVELFYGRGAFDSTAIRLTSQALMMYSLGLIGIGIRDILSRVFYVMQDTKTPMINSVIGMVLNIILNIILSRYLGIGGLALATSISSIFTMMLMFISLRNRIGPFGMKTTSWVTSKILLGSLIMGGIVRISYYIIAQSLGQSISLFLSVITGVLFYVLMLYFMKIRDVDIIFNSIKLRIRGYF